MVQRHIAGGLLTKTLAQSVAAVGTSLAQDAAATVLGSEQGVEGGKAVVSGVGGMMSEPIARFFR
jgi:hypothetical protein